MTFIRQVLQNIRKKLHDSRILIILLTCIKQNWQDICALQKDYPEEKNCCKILLT